MDPNQPPTYPTPVKVKMSHKILKSLRAFLVALVILCLASYAAYAWIQNTDLQKNVSIKEAENKTLAAQIESLQDKSAGTNATITELLPNGKVATYPDTDGNRNILFWSAGNDNATANFILLSHKSIQQFLSGVNSDTIVKLCGTDTNLKALKYNISVGIFNTDEKILGQPQNGSCLDVLASNSNPDNALRVKAQSVINQVKDDTDNFIKSVSLK